MERILYLASNEPGGNRVLAVADDGERLRVASSSPAGGTGADTAGSDFDADDYDGNVVVDPGRDLLFVTNGGSDSVAVFGIGQGGGLAPVAGSPFPTGGPHPVSVAVVGDGVVVVNKDRDPARPSTPEGPGYAAFRLTTDRRLEPLGSVAVPRGASPTQVLPAGEKLAFGAHILSGVLQSFRIGGEGRMVLADQAAVPGGPPGPIGLAVHPHQQLLYVGMPASAQVGVFAFDDEGSMAFAVASASSGRATCWVVVAPDGLAAYAANNADNSVSAFDLTDPEAPVEIQHLRLRGGSAAYQIALDPSGSTLYALSTNAASGRADDNVVHRLEVGVDRRMVERARALVLPVDPRAHPGGIAVGPLVG